MDTERGRGLTFRRDGISVGGLSIAQAQLLLSRYDDAEVLTLAASDEALATVRELKQDPKLQIGNAKKWLRSQGPDGAALAARLGNQSVKRVAIAHPMGALLRDLRQFARRHAASRAEAVEKKDLGENFKDESDEGDIDT